MFMLVDYFQKENHLTNGLICFCLNICIHIFEGILQGSQMAMGSMEKNIQTQHNYRRHSNLDILRSIYSFF